MFAKDHARVSNCLPNSFHPSPLIVKGSPKGSFNYRTYGYFFRVDKTEKNEENFNLNNKFHEL